MKTLIIFLAVTALMLGCARVRVEGSKEPIKVDIAMRLDVYQHVQKDINDIESIVSGGRRQASAPGPQSFLRMIVADAYAAGDLAAEIENAAGRRKLRVQDLISLEARGIVGEDNRGFVAVRAAGGADTSAAALVKEENADRMIIYEALAQRNETSLVDIQLVYAQRLQKDAPAGTPVQSPAGTWAVKD